MEINIYLDADEKITVVDCKLGYESLANIKGGML